MSAGRLQPRREALSVILATLACATASAQQSETYYFYNDTFDVVRQYTYDRPNDQTFNNTLYAYDEIGRMTASVLASDPQRATYDGTSNGPDAVTLYVYDSADHVVKTIRKGRVGETPNVAHGPEPGDSVTTYEFDALGRQTKTLLPDGGETELTYDLADNVLQSRTLLTSGVYATTTYEYDKAGRVVLTSNQSVASLTSYYTSGVPYRVEQTVVGGARLAASQYTYDNALRLLRLTNYNPVPVAEGDWVPDLGTDDITEYTYDDDGRVEFQFKYRSDIDAQGAPIPIVTSYAYDAIGRLVDTYAPEGVSTHIEPDATWQTLASKITREDGLTPALETDLTYHSTQPVVLDLLIGAEGGPPPEMLTCAFAYNALHQVTATTDPMSRVAEVDMDARGQHTQRIEDFGQGFENRQTNVELDRNGLPATLTAHDSGGGPQQETTYTHDLLDRATKVEFPCAVGNNEVLLEYDLAGRLTKQTIQNGHVLTYAYDTRGNLLTRTMGDASTPDSYRHVYEYDALSRVTLARREQIYQSNTVAAETTFAYDALSRVTQETQKLFGESTGRTLTYQYDQFGNRVFVQFAPTLPEKIELKYHYDELNQNTLVQARFNTKRNTNRTNYIDLIRYVYSGSILQSRVIRTLYNDEAPYVNAELELAQIFEYDVQRRPVAIANKTHWGAQQVNLDELAEYHYEYDKRSNPLTATGDYALASNEGYSYIQDRPTLEYDRLNRLTLLHGEDAHNQACYSESFTYDHLGNVDAGFVGLGSNGDCPADDEFNFASDVANQYTALDRDAETFELGYNL
ncbi:MAG: RHS repeat protein, partial [Phycisphaerales bacterium]|nr:RHS repeat protein [Phycisphaerales bacterium]